MITLTKDAINRIKSFSDEEGIGHFNIRIKICGGKCAGMYYDMIFDDVPPTELDEVLEQDGVKIYIDCLSLTYMKDITLDYISTKFGSGFKFIGGEETKSCGCGSSFSP